MSTLIGTAPYQVVATEQARNPIGISPVEHFEADSSKTTRVYDIAWTDRRRAYLGLLGYNDVSTTADGVKFYRRYTPWADPDWTRFGSFNAYYLFCSSVDTVGVKTKTLSSAFTGTYQTARVTASFQTRPWEVLTDDQVIHTSVVSGTPRAFPDESFLERYVTKEFTPNAQFLTVPEGSYFQVGDGNGIIEVGTARMLVSFNLQITHHLVPEAGVPSRLINPNCTTPSIDLTLGRVNNATFGNTISGSAAGFPRGTLLLVAVQLKPYRDPFGQRVYDIRFMFKYFDPANAAQQVAGNTIRAGHNHVYRPRSPTLRGWYEAVAAAPPLFPPTTNIIAQVDNKSIYDWADYRPLFRPVT